MSFRAWLSIVTIALLGIVVALTWDEVTQAFGYLTQVNLWILALIIPLQFVSYYAVGEMIFSYLRAKGHLKELSSLRAARMALEFNFVNHVFPSGGAAGMSYMGWQLGKHGVRPGRATMAQIVRFALTFFSFILLLLVALVVLIIDHTVSRSAILMSLLLVVLAIGGTILGVYIISSPQRLRRFSVWLTRRINHVVRKVTRGKKARVLAPHILTEFFEDMHDDYVEIRREKGILVRPFLWSIVSNVADVAMLFIAFWSFGVYINPAMLFIAYGLSSVTSAFAVTPGGAGVYEAVMITFLVSAGVGADVAIAGILLARVLLMAGTIIFGYVFYQLTVVKYGKSPVQR